MGSGISCRLRPAPLNENHVFHLDHTQGGQMSHYIRDGLIFPLLLTLPANSDIVTDRLPFCVTIWQTRRWDFNGGQGRAQLGCHPSLFPWAIYFLSLDGHLDFILSATVG